MLKKNYYLNVFTRFKYKLIKNKKRARALFELSKGKKNSSLKAHLHLIPRSTSRDFAKLTRNLFKLLKLDTYYISEMIDRMHTFKTL